MFLSENKGLRVCSIYDGIKLNDSFDHASRDDSWLYCTTLWLSRPIQLPERLFLCCSSSLWNSLLNYLTDSDVGNNDTFRRHLKTMQFVTDVYTAHERYKKCTSLSRRRFHCSVIDLANESDGIDSRFKQHYCSVLSLCALHQ